jgi:non-ribosomal peptide synthetase-like protein
VEDTDNPVWVRGHVKCEAREPAPAGAARHDRLVQRVAGIATVVAVVATALALVVPAEIRLARHDIGPAWGSLQLLTVCLGLFAAGALLGVTDFARLRRTLKRIRQRQVTDRYARAIEQLRLRRARRANRRHLRSGLNPTPTLTATASVTVPAPSGGVAVLLAPVPPETVTARTAAGPQGGLAEVLAGVLAEVIKAEHVPVGSHFFDELGADSLVMAKFCARLRKLDDLPSPSMQDIYHYPTIRSLATALAGPVPAPAAAATMLGAPAAGPEPAAATDAGPVTAGQYIMCGTVQFLFFLGYVWVAALVGVWAYRWISAGTGLAGLYLRAVLFGGAVFLVLCLLPILAKWVLIGRWTSRQIRIWSLDYVRFWVVRTLVRSNPLVLVAVGSPLYVLYLRALGARVGKGTVIFSRHVPVCTDLLTIGPDTVIRKDAFLSCYRAQAGWIQPGPVTLGRKVFIGEKSVLDIDTWMGDAASLGHASALHSGQRVPAGRRWHGSPAQPTDVNYLRIPAVRCGTLRRVRFCAVSLLCVFLLYLPLAEGGVYLLATSVPALGRVLSPGGTAIASPALYLDALFVSLVLFFGLVLGGLLFVTTVPRLLNQMIRPDTVYPLYGFHDRVHRGIARLTGVRFFTHLFGDSSYIVYYLRWLGYDLGQVVQTGSNFGTEVGHEIPFLSTIGRGTMVADGLSMMNADYSSMSFRVSRVSIGADNFVGNNIAYPAGGRTGENCLLATKAMIPLDGRIREGVGLLGSPCFEIPRSVERDSRFDDLRAGEDLGRRLAAKNRYNLRTMGVFLAGRWLHVFLVTVFALAAFDAYGGFAQAQTAAWLALAVLVTPVYFVLVERGMRGFRRLEPRFCSIYDPCFWRHERLWKVPGEAYLHMFDGTPFKNLIWRGLGVRIGKRVFDDGCYLTERTLTSIGDDCMLNAGSKIQCHSQEDGTFKSGRTVIGAGCTLGVGAMVHYGVMMADGSALAADSFLMKGEEVPRNARWGGNPAREM